MARPTPPRWLRRTWRPLRRLLRLALALVAVAVLLVAVVLLLAPARRVVLERGLAVAAGALPGELTVQRAAWPRLGRLALDGVVWTDGADTLARADTLRLDLDLRALWRHDLVVQRVLAAGLGADVPAILTRLPADTTGGPATAPADTVATPVSVPWLREGALPPLPSVALERLAIRRVRIAVADTLAPVRLDSLIAGADLRPGHEATLHLHLLAWPRPELGVRWGLDGRLGADSLRVDLAPLEVAVGGAAPSSGGSVAAGRLAVPRAWLRELTTAAAAVDPWPHLALAGLRIAGAAGRWQLDARLAGRAAGEVVLRSEIPDAPLPLLATLGGADLLPGAVADSLRARWAEGRAPAVDLTLAVAPPPAPQPPRDGRYRVHGRVHLPPPAALAPLLPPQLAVDDLGPVDLILDGHHHGDRTPATWAADLDLGATPWLEAARLRAGGTLERVRLDTLALRLPGLALAASGRASADSVDLALSLDVPDSTLLRRWRDPALAGLGLALRADLQARGALPLPRVSVAARGALRTPRLHLPEVTAAALAGPDTVDVALELPRGLHTAARPLDHARLAFAGAAEIHEQRVPRLRGDLRASLRAGQQAVTVVSRLRARDLTGVPAGTLTTDTLRITLGDRQLRNRQPWRLTAAAAGSLLTVRDLDLAGPLGSLRLAADVAPDTLAGDAALDLELAREVLLELLPPEAAALLPRAALVASGQVAARGRPAAPWARVLGRVGFAGNPDLEPLHLSARASVGGRGQPPAELEPADPPWSPGRITAEVALAEADTTLLRLFALAPLPHLVAGPDSVRLAVTAERSDLSRLNPLLPGGTSVEGRLDADAHARGLTTPGQQRPDLQLGGSLELSRVRARGPDGSWVALAGRVDLGGSSHTPRIRGGLTIEGGLIRLPEPPPMLLPAEGEAMLWEAAPAAAGTGDRVAAGADSTTAAEPLPAIVPDLEFGVHAPGGLWLRGQGLDVELAGDLTLRLQEGVPGLTGQLEALQGTMRQLGHVFQLERGLITFHGDEPQPDPQLDLRLGVKVSGTQVWITLGGRATEPQLEFSSEPPLSDGDIVSLLLFGKTADELDEGQAGLVADRAGQIALSYGATALQEAVAKEVGLDVVTVGPGSAGDETTTLTVGKYLSPRVLVRYEQILDEESGFYLHLDYRISGPLKLHTQVSQGQASGAEFAWEKDF